MRVTRPVLLALSFLAAASSLASDLKDVKARGTLRVLVNPDVRRPEFFSVRPGTPPGLDQEVLRGFAALHRVTLEPVVVDGWDALMPALAAERGDLIAGRFTATETRRKTIAFTTEVFPYRLVVLNRKPALPILTLEQLRREKVGSTKGTIMAELLDAAGVSSRDDDIPTGGYAEALKSGRVTATVWGVESAIASQKDDPGLQLGMFLGAPGSLAYGVRKEDTQLLAALNSYIDDLRRTPTCME